jgi:hypothetical protein
MSPYQNKAAMQEHIPQWQASHLTQAEYCKIHGIKPHIFSYYKKQFSSTIPPVKQANPLIPVKLVAEDSLGGSKLFLVCHVLYWFRMCTLIDAYLCSSE